MSEAEQKDMASDDEIWMHSKSYSPDADSAAISYKNVLILTQGPKQLELRMQSYAYNAWHWLANTQTH